MTKDAGGGWLKWLVIIVLLAAVIGGGVWYYQEHSGPETQYQTAAVTKGDVTQAVTATGQLNPVVNVQVGSQVSGRIQKLYADFNTPVKEGQIVAQLDPSIYQ